MLEREIRLREVFVNCEAAFQLYFLKHPGWKHSYSGIKKKKKQIIHSVLCSN